MRLDLPQVCRGAVLLFAEGLAWDQVGKWTLLLGSSSEVLVRLLAHQRDLGRATLDVQR